MLAQRNARRFSRGLDILTVISDNTKIRCTNGFLTWINKVDRSLRIRIDQRIQRLAQGYPGQHRRFDNILELKWSSGAIGSFRIYLCQLNHLILLLGGHKDTQRRDIKKAKLILIGVKNGTIRVKTYE